MTIRSRWTSCSPGCPRPSDAAAPLERKDAHETPRRHDRFARPSVLGMRSGEPSERDCRVAHGPADDCDRAKRHPAFPSGTRRELHRVCPRRASVQRDGARARVRGPRELRARRSHGMAHASARPAVGRDGGRRLDPAMGRPHPGNPPRRRRLDPSGSETLARSERNEQHDAYRDSGAPRRQDRRLDGTRD